MPSQPMHIVVVEPDRQDAVESTRIRPGMDAIPSGETASDG